MPNGSCVVRREKRQKIEDIKKNIRDAILVRAVIDILENFVRLT